MVKRWDITTDRTGGPAMQQDDYGSWVAFSDYQELQNLVDGLQVRYDLALKRASDAKGTGF
jgi:hypothetical protein